MSVLARGLIQAVACAALATALAAAVAPRSGTGDGNDGELPGQCARQRVAKMSPSLVQLKKAMRAGANLSTTPSSLSRFCGIAVNKEQGNDYDSDDLASAAGIVGAPKLWHYNWKMTSKVHVHGVQFVPMIKEPGQTLGQSIGELPAANTEGIGSVVKGWNEPDDAGQAGRDINLRSNPEAFAAAWTSDMQAAKAKGYTEFIGPAMAHDTCWLDYFLKACEAIDGCKELVTYLAFHRYRLDCSSYSAKPDNDGWRDDLSYLLTYYRLMQKYNARGFKIKGLVFDELGCLTPSYTFSGESEQLQYMREWYKLTLVAVKTGDAETMDRIRSTKWIMPRGPDAHSGKPYSLGMCTAVDGGATAAEDAVKAIQSLVTVAWFSISPGANHLFAASGGRGLSNLGRAYFDACKDVKKQDSSPAAPAVPSPGLPAPAVPEPAAPATAAPAPQHGGGDDTGADDLLDAAVVKIVSEVTGKTLFATSVENWERGIGAGSDSEHSDDGAWRLVRVAAGQYKIVSKYADRALYAPGGSNWEQGLGAGSPSSDVGSDGVWKFVAQGKSHRYRIVNALTDRCLYSAASGSFGAGSPANAVGIDGVWIVEAQQP